MALPRVIGFDGPKGLRRRVLDPEGLLVARHRFLFEGVIPGDVPMDIVRSWQRSRDGGLDMTRIPDVETLQQQQLKERRDANEALIRAARSELDLLVEDARMTGGMVILAAPDGVVLATAGDMDFVERAARVALRPGAVWGEAQIGTNAIGMSIAERQSLSVIGGEHFIDAHSFLSCSAVPIIDPTGAVAGVLDMTNPVDVPQVHTLALIRRAADQIERRLFEARFGTHDQVHFHAAPDLLGSPREGVLAFDADRVVGANRHGLELLDLDWTALGKVRFQQLFAADPEVLERHSPAEDYRLRTMGGSTLFARVQPSPRKTESVAAPFSREAEPAEVEDNPELTLREIVERILKGPGGRTLHFRQVKAGQILYGSDEVDAGIDGLVVVRSGRLRVFASFEGKELTLFTLDAGDAIHLTRTAMLEVKKDAEIVLIPAAVFRRLALSDPDLALSAMPVIDQLLQKSIRMIEDMVFRGVKHRVIRAICDTADRDGRKAAHGIVIDAPPNAEELAMQIGATRQSVSTIIAELIRGGLLHRAGTSAMVIADLDRLKQELRADR